ncbi:cell division protein FtsK [Mycobacteroides abscessus subsp. abscessus]|uniref:FtsK/SpoIIIE domain-containing protein n=1 Tax=Mycobacteroides abscessus TaxID=36809 RepID=UPI00092C056B|nr:FtsK/SpoIIIE domain-containing protein [Mycobacteroides abscessus]MDM2351259.1 FtsK/SpoIIIE domain-containing protein [Mycobacteroides abscessus]MDM2361345.1 FtsK/SpoIIIE domain-containing protein [Mycobacteroides abscessus]QSN53239.1 cell division protein FtsK [Mycobacteroides abscessus subsp. abscessus]SII21629.1 cell division protein FtsK [Mycobacteroides abscessus subsp. abscessus]SII81760.1 cell division protein FtsK [Mycobacteroides abscessus subsp. abscessus]
MSNAKSKNNSQSSNDDWIGEIFIAVLSGIGKLLWWGIRFPLLGIPVAVALGMAIWQGANAGFLTVLGFLALFTLWGVLDEESFQRWVIDPLTQYFLRWSRYLCRWEKVCTACGLTVKVGERHLVPAVLGIGIGKHADILDVRVVTGQSITNWHKQAEALAAAFKADRITIAATAPGELRITIMRGDVLAEPVALPRPVVVARVNLSAVPVGVTENHGVWRVPILGHHILVAGATGAGKGSVLWSLIAGLAPDIRTGRVRLCVIDPKGGMELGAGAPMFSFFSHDATGQTLELLRALVGLMHERANQLRGHARLHTPTRSDPLFVIVIDEIAALTAYVTDRKIRAEIEQLLGLLLSQGRAVGISVVGAIQDPSKDALPLRQLFTVRIGLRLTEASQTAMVLGQGARDASAECDLIPDSTPGVGYVMIDGTATPTRVRAFHVTDSDISYLVRIFPATRPRKRTGGQGGTGSVGGEQQ